MSTQQLHKFLQNFIHNGRIQATRIPKGIRLSEVFQNLERSGIIKKGKAKNAGFIYTVEKEKDLIAAFQARYPGNISDEISSIANLRAFKDTKAKHRPSNRVALIRGHVPAIINETSVPIGNYTKTYGLFSAIIREIRAEKICIVENLDTFLIAERIIPKDYLFVHFYGRLGKEIIKGLNAVEILLFSDFDYVGLNEYLLLKSEFDNAKFYMPDDFDALFKTYGKPLKKKNGQAQVPSNAVKFTSDPTVLRIRDDIYRTNKFLEQQALFIE